MRKLLTCTLLLTFMITACNKKTTQPDPQPQQSTLSSTQLALCGHWILRTTDTYSAQDSLLGSQTHTDTISCILDLRTSQSASNAQIGALDCTFGLGCNPTEGGWQVNASYLQMFNQNYYILRLTQDTLKLKSPGMVYYISTLTR